MTDYDSPWKDVLDPYFEEFMMFFFPAAHAAIDWHKGLTFMDKELTKIVKDAAQGKKYVDKLVKVHLRNGRTATILIHLEVQGNREKDFAKRMFVYSYRLFDRYDLKVASMALLCDEDSAWRPDSYGYEILNCSHRFSYPVVKLLDHGDDWERLAENENPFALVVLAHLMAMKTVKSTEERYHGKLKLIRLLYRKNYPKQAIQDFLRFIDWVLALPKGLEEELTRTIEAETEGDMTAYVTSWERIGEEKGVTRLFLRMITKKFGAPPQWVHEKIEEADPDTIERWADNILTADNLEMVFD